MNKIENTTLEDDLLTIKHFEKIIKGEIVDKKILDRYKLSSDKKGLLVCYDKIGGGKDYHIHSNEMTKEERAIKTNLLIEEKQFEFLKNEHNRLLGEAKVFHKKILDSQNNNNELKYYTYGFECPNIDNLKTKEQKDNIYNKLLNQFNEELKKWIYNNN